MTILVEQDPELIRHVREGLGADVQVAPTIERVHDQLAQHPGEFAVVLGRSVDEVEGGAFAETMRIHRPTLGVIMLRDVVDSAVLASALRSGMRDVLATDDSEGLSEAVGRVRTLAQAMAAPGEAVGPATNGHLVTVFANKGGVGKSMVATNVASALAAQGHRVCIVDLDVQSGDVAIMLQLNPSHTLTDLSQLANRIDPSGVASLLTEQSENLSVLAAPVQLGTNVPTAPVNDVLETLKTMFEVVIVDTSGSFDDLALVALDHSDLLVLVSTLDIPALKNLKLAVGTLDLLNFPRERWRLVLNRADAKVGLSSKDFEQTLGMKAAASLPSSRDVLAAVNRGEAIVRSSPGHQVSKALNEFAKGLFADATAPGKGNGNGAGSRRAPKRRLRMKKVD